MEEGSVGAPASAAESNSASAGSRPSSVPSNTSMPKGARRNASKSHSELLNYLPRFRNLTVLLGCQWLIYQVACGWSTILFATGKGKGAPQMQLRFFVSVLLVCSATAMGDEPKQPTIGYRSAPLLTVDGLTFKDLNRNGKLDPFEDWRLPAEVRTADLVQRMSLEELAGVMVLPETVPRLAAMERAPGRSPSRRTSVRRGEWNI
jgi:hypothetical protein